jgi:hypothetical protein
VLDLTDGEGADVVFEGVASAETMDHAARMLRRRGRLVFVGYGADPFVVNPLLLVLREAQVLGAVGNTLAELHEAVALAAGGWVRAIVGERVPLEQVGAALEALRAGRVVGRAVLEPNGPLPPAPSTAPPAPRTWGMRDGGTSGEEREARGGPGIGGRPHPDPLPGGEGEDAPAPVPMQPATVEESPVAPSLPAAAVTEDHAPSSPPRIEGSGGGGKAKYCKPCRLGGGVSPFKTSC